MLPCYTDSKVHPNYIDDVKMWVKWGFQNQWNELFCLYTFVFLFNCYTPPKDLRVSFMRV